MKKAVYLILIFLNIGLAEAQEHILKPVSFRSEDQSYEDGVLTARPLPNTNNNNNQGYEAFRLVPRFTSNEIYYRLVALDPHEANQAYNLLRKKYIAQINDAQEMNGEDKMSDEVE